MAPRTQNMRAPVNAAKAHRVAMGLGAHLRVIQTRLLKFESISQSSVFIELYSNTKKPFR
jgi:hypothetical protein